MYTKVMVWGDVCVIVYVGVTVVGCGPFVSLLWVHW